MNINLSPLPRKLSKLVALVQDPVFIRGLCKGVAATVEHRELLEQLRPGIVVDVGANRGQFSLLARSLFPDAQVIAFEPLAGAASDYSRLFGDDEQVTLHCCALGSRTARVEMYVSRRDDCSSLLPIGPDQVRFASGTGLARREPVLVERLDALLQPQDLDGDALLKIDVQGYELEVIRGAGELLDQFRHIYCEVSFIPLYLGQPLATDVINALADRGYRLTSVNQVSFLDGVPAQADMLFERA